jgi:enamine deaminase RidA (YjgF/YER057c/UK114 family)
LEPTDYPFFDYRRFTFSLAIATSKGVWLAGSTAVQYDKTTKQMVVRGDLIDQANVIYDKMSKTLRAGGLDVKNILRIVQYVTPIAIEDLPRLAELHRAKFEGQQQPSICTIVVNRLLRDEALIEIEAVASAEAVSAVRHIPTITAASHDDAWQSAERQLAAAGSRPGDVLRTLELRSPAIPDHALRRMSAGSASSEVIVPCLADRSQGVQIEIAVSQAAAVVYATAAGNPTAGGIVEQARDAYAKVEARLKQAGLGFANIVKTTEFITPDSLADYRRTADVRRDLFEAPYPAATGVVCERLPQAGSQIVIEAIALNEGA